MKVIKVLVLTAVLFLGVNTAMAQSKLGHINVPLLISLMPEAKKADAQLETMAKGFQADFEKPAPDQALLRFRDNVSKERPFQKHSYPLYEWKDPLLRGTGRNRFAIRSLHALPGND